MNQHRTGSERQSTGRLSERADGAFDLRESDCGNVSGQARFAGSRLLAEWTAVLGLCRGRTEIEFDVDCQRGHGEVVMAANALACSGRHVVTCEREGLGQRRVEGFALNEGFRLEAGPSSHSAGRQRVTAVSVDLTVVARSGSSRGPFCDGKAWGLSI